MRFFWKKLLVRPPWELFDSASTVLADQSPGAEREAPCQVLASGNSSQLGGTLRHAVVRLALMTAGSVVRVRTFPSGSRPQCEGRAFCASQIWRATSSTR